MAFARLENYIIIVIAFQCSLAARAASTCSSQTSSKNLLMHQESITLLGEKALLGANINKLSFWTYKRGKWQRILFQIDQKNDRDEYVLNEGLPFTRGSDDFYYDSNDEITIRASSLGEDFTKKSALPTLTNRAVKKWLLRVCSDNLNVVGNLMVLEHAHSFKKSYKPAVRLNKNGTTIDSNFYRYFFNPENAILLGKIYLKNKDGFVPAIESSRFLMPIATPWFMPDLQIKDLHFDSQIESWQQGPIRTIVAVGVKYSRLFSLIKLHLFSELIFYESKLLIPTSLHFPIDASKFLNPGSGIAYSIKFPSDSEWQIDTNIPTLPPKTPEWVVRNAKSLKKPDFYEANGTNKNIGYGFSVRVALEPHSIQEYPPPFIAQQSDFRNSKMISLWSWLKKIPGDLGVFVDLSKVRKGDYNFGLNVDLFELSADTSRESKIRKSFIESWTSYSKRLN